MEDPRISRMYAALAARAAERAVGQFRNGGWLRSSVTWIILLVLVLIGVGIAIHEKGTGDLTKIKTELGTPQPAAAVASPQPGGQDPVVLSRAQQMGGITPEFLTATLLPGRGMNVLQITAYLPGKGEVALLQAPFLNDAATAMSGIGDDVNGEQSLAMGGAMEIPWAGRIFGSVLPGGLSVLTNWHGRALTLPVDSAKGDPSASVGGLLLKRASSRTAPEVMPDGGVAQATFQAGSFDGHWPSQTEVKTTVLLSARTIDLTINVHNVGTEPEPVGIGWRPRFAIHRGRADVRLKLPSTLRLETSRDLPTGKQVPVEGTEFDFSGTDGRPLGTTSLDDTFVHLRSGSLSSGAEAELRYPAEAYGVRLTALSATIKAFHVSAPADQPILTLDPQTNYDDPLGREWSAAEDTGLVVLQPGESTQWKVRLELFPVSPDGKHVGPS